MKHVPDSVSFEDSLLLAALVDGRLDAAEHQALLARIDASPALQQVLADVSRLLVESDDDAEPHAPITPLAVAAPALLQKRWTPRQWVPLTSLAAAALVIAVAWPTLRRSSISEANATSPNLAAIVLLPASTVLPSRPNWDATRAGSSSLSEQSRSVRLGVALADLAASVGNGRDSTVVALRANIEGMLSEIPEAGPAAAALRSTNLAARDTAQFAVAVRAIEQIVVRSAYDAGAAIESMRLAVLRHDVSFFQTGSKALFDRAGSSSQSSNAETATNLDAAQNAVSATPPDWQRAETAFANALRLIGN